MLTTIKTQRLTLRSFNESDAGRIAYLAGDYDVARMCGRVPHPYPMSAAYGFLGMIEKARESGAEHSFAVTAPFDNPINLKNAYGTVRLAVTVIVE